mmetsp:Transcript_59630/g.159786  ORF Transcript_59630/g.159786 Transcript_59630/m.159786 type:complete len:116 (-) Transcript_59630:49-396(-)
MGSPLLHKDLDTLTEVEVVIPGTKRTETVTMDPQWGPVRLKLDGNFEYTDFNTRNDMQFQIGRDRNHVGKAAKPWRQFSSTEKEITIVQVAKMNAATRERREAEMAKLVAAAGSS